MSEAEFNATLRLKIRETGKSPPGSALRPENPEMALTRALRHAAAPFDGLVAEPEAMTPNWDIALKDGIAKLPEHRLIAVLEGANQMRALCVLDNGLVDALVEVQTTGKVDKPTGLVRAPTKIDAALTRDFIGLFLSAFASEISEERAVNWPTDLTYGTHVTDIRQLELLLPSQPYHLFRARMTMGDGKKEGEIQLLVPVTGEAPIDAGAGLSKSVENDKSWQSIAALVTVPLDGVLMRKSIPLSRLDELQEGFFLRFEPEDLNEMPLCDLRGVPVLKGRLGRKGGDRAVLVTSGLTIAEPARPAPLAAENPAPIVDDRAPIPDRAEELVPSAQD